MNNMEQEVRFENGIRSCNVELTPSKSISNRALIIRSLSDNFYEIDNLSNSTDTQSLLKALEFKNREINVNDAGTSFRFLVARLAIQQGEWQLSGSKRMLERPIGLLVDSLRKQGAQIDYLGIENFPPLKIVGCKLKGGEIEIDGSVSSQFISSLMMLGPCLQGGLKIEVKKKLLSLPYIKMTAALMENAGVSVTIDDSLIKIPEGKYSCSQMNVENDWSSASYWYLLCSLNPGTRFVLNKLNEQSIQGDSSVADLMKSFGIETEFIVNGIEIHSTDTFITEFEFDFSNIPDLAITFAFLCAAKGIKAHLRGVSNLRYKESDRLEVLVEILGKFGVISSYSENDFYIHPGKMINPGVVNAHSDHRFVMAVAMLSSVVGSFKIDGVDAVAKSYPEFWNQLKGVGGVLV